MEARQPCLDRRPVGSALKVLFVTGATHKPYMVNFNHYQRVYFLSRQARLTIYARKGADFACSATEGTEVVNAPFRGKFGMVLFFIWWLVIRNRSGQFDIVLTEPSKLCICGFLAKLLLGAKWVVDVWDIPFRCGSKAERPLRRCIVKVDRTIARVLFRYADLFLLSILPDLEFAEFKIPERKILLLKNAIWLSEKGGGRIQNDRAARRPFRVLCMRSRFSSDSGLDLLTEAFERLNRSEVDMELTIVGDIPKTVESQVRCLRDRSNVHFRPFVEHEELLRMIASCSACVIPYRKTSDLSQIFPIKVLEYLSEGAVVVAPDLPGIASVITHGQNGLLFRPDDPAELAEKLRTIYEDPQFATRISAQAAALNAEFDCRNKAVRILGVLERLAFGQNAALNSAT